MTTVDVLIHEAPFLTGIHRRVGDTVFATLRTPPPDRWKRDREDAEELPTSCRVRRSKTRDKDTGAWIYFGQVWYPHGVKPVLDNKFITEEGREMAIDEALGLHDKNEPQDVGDVFVPYTTDPAAAFQLALGIGAE